MANQTIALLSLRAAERLGFDVPPDLLSIECSDVLGVTRGVVRAEIKKRLATEAGKPAFDRSPMFGFPTMPTSSRMRSSGGLQPFHFALNKGLERSAAAFDRYASEAEKAARKAELNQQKLGSRIAEAEPNDTHPGLAISTVTASGRDSYALDHGQGDTAVSNMVTNLELNPVERHRQWDVIEDHERRAGLVHKETRIKGSDRINIRVDHAPKMTAAIAADPNCPPDLAALIVLDTARYDNGLAPSKRRKASAAWITNDAAHVHGWIRSTEAWSAATKAERLSIAFSAGRAVQTHVAFELEMPTEFDTDAFINVRDGLHRHLSGLSRTGPLTGSNMQLPSMMTTHWPGMLNDARNPHIHGLIGTRCCSLGEAGEFILDDKDRPIFADTKVPEIVAFDFPKKLRVQCANLINIELDRLGAEHRLSPETYAKLGIPATPQEKLHGGQTVLSRAAVMTPTEHDNVVEAWRRAFAEVDKRSKQELVCKQVDTDRLCQDIDERELPLEERERLQNERVAAFHLESEGLKLQREAAQIDLLIEMARSRPSMVAQFAPEYAAKAGKDNRHSYDVAGWQARAEAAGIALIQTDRELNVEYGARDERLAEAKLLIDRAKQAREAIVYDLDMANVNAAYAQSEQIVATAKVRLNSAEVNKLVDDIIKLPLRLVESEGLLCINPKDDPLGQFDTALFESSSMQKRLRKIEADRRSMPKPLAAWMAANPEVDPQAAPIYIAELARRWNVLMTKVAAAPQARADLVDTAASMPVPIVLRASEPTPTSILAGEPSATLVATSASSTLRTKRPSFDEAWRSLEAEGAFIVRRNDELRVHRDTLRKVGLDPSWLDDVKVQNRLRVLHNLQIDQINAMRRTSDGELLLNVDADKRIRVRSGSSDDQRRVDRWSQSPDFVDCLKKLSPSFKDSLERAKHFEPNGKPERGLRDFLTWIKDERADLVVDAYGNFKSRTDRLDHERKLLYWTSINGVSRLALDVYNSAGLEDAKKLAQAHRDVTPSPIIVSRKESRTTRRALEPGIDR